MYFSKLFTYHTNCCHCIVSSSTHATDLEFGRLFNEEENLGRKRVAVIGSAVPRALGSNASMILNKEILVAGTSYKVVGILKEEG